MSQPMKKRIKDIAADIGVSVATVSRVMNNKPGVGTQTRNLVLQYLSDHGGVPNYGSLFKTIGVVDTFSRHRIDSYYLSELIEGADERIHAMNYVTTLIHSDIIEKELLTYGKPQILNHLSGIMWMEPMFNEKYFNVIKNMNIPCVVVNNCEENISIDFIKSDNLKASKSAIRLLFDHGHRQIGFIGGYLNLANHRDRFNGYKAGLEELGIEFDPELVIDDITSWDRNGGAAGMYRLLSHKNIPSAVMICSDFLAEGAYDAVKSKNYKIPDQISLLSFDDFPLAAYLDPPLTTFRQPLHEIGVAAANRLFEIISDFESEIKNPRHTLVDCPLKLRKSIAMTG